MNVLLIGTGMVSHTHLLALRDNGAGVRLGAVLGRDRDRTASFCTQAADLLGYPVKPLTDVDAALRAAPDMALLITPPDARAQFATVLAQAGIPTLMEKPIERTLAAAQAITATYARAAVPLGLCFQHRMRAAAQALRARITAGDLGDIIHVDIRVPWWRDQSYYDAPGRGSYARDGGGVMINQAIHTLDLAIWLTGPVSQVQAQMYTSPLHRMEAEDIATALLRFQTGASGALSASTATYPGSTESIALTTTRAQVLLQGDALHIDWHDGRRDHSGAGASTGGGSDPMAFTHAWHQGLIENFADSLRRGTQPAAPANEALHVHAVIHAMEQAARNGTLTKVPT